MENIDHHNTNRQQTKFSDGIEFQKKLRALRILNIQDAVSMCASREQQMGDQMTKRAGGLLRRPSCRRPRDRERERGGITSSIPGDRGGAWAGLSGPQPDHCPPPLSGNAMGRARRRDARRRWIPVGVVTEQTMPETKLMPLDFTWEKSHHEGGIPNSASQRLTLRSQCFVCGAGFFCHQGSSMFATSEVLDLWSSRLSDRTRTECNIFPRTVSPQFAFRLEPSRPTENDTNLQFTNSNFNKGMENHTRMKQRVLCRKRGVILTDPSRVRDKGDWGVGCGGGGHRTAPARWPFPSGSAPSAAGKATLRCRRLETLG